LKRAAEENCSGQPGEGEHDGGGAGGKGSTYDGGYGDSGNIDGFHD